MSTFTNQLKNFAAAIEKKFISHEKNHAAQNNLPNSESLTGNTVKVTAPSTKPKKNHKEALSVFTIF